MLKLIEGLPDDVIGIEAAGKVEASDYRQVLDPATATTMQAHSTIRLLYLLGEHYEDYTAAAMWEDTKLGFHDLSAWDRIAVVTDHDVLRDAIKVFGWMIPGDVRTYTLDQLEEAKGWVSEHTGR